MSNAAMLAVENLEVVYQRSITALHGVTFAVDQGQIVAVLGANGAGKTTTLRAISGFIGLDNARVTKGAIRFKGEAIENRPPNKITQLGIVLIPERDKVFPNLSVAENLTAVRSSRISAQEHRRLERLVYEAFPRLANLRDKEAGLLSGGERQMLAIAAAIVCGPELMLIDELSLGLAPVIVEDLANRLLQVRKELGVTLLLVEQAAAVALRIADHAYVLENGRVVMQGKAEELRRNEDIQRFYLGTAAGERRSYRDAAARRSRSSHA
jgi:branched-chain amino acid transport system ATP-binding protein